MKIIPCAQGSLEWLVARSGIPTASEFDQLLTPEFKIRTGQMPASYLAKKTAEWWIGGPLPGFTGLDMDFGKILEDEAIPGHMAMYESKIDRVGLVTNDEGTIGCSPDGLIGEDGGIEIKCPEPTAHVKYLLAGEVPKDYVAQVHGAMFVTGRPWWEFFSYRRKFPWLRLRVNRDEKIQATIGEALEMFLEQFEASKEEMIRLNGGPPIRPTMKLSEPAPEPTWMHEGVTP